MSEHINETEQTTVDTIEPTEQTTVETVEITEQTTVDTVELTDEEFDEYFVSTCAIDYDDIPDEDDERYESNSSRVRSYLEAKSTAEPASEPTQRKRSSFINRLETFVYYHKILTVLIVVAVLVTALWGGIALSRSRIDYNIGLYTENAKLTSEQISAIEKVFAECGDDVNRDGRVIVKVSAHRNLTGDSIVSFFTRQLTIRRDIIGDVKNGWRVNDILITDAIIRDNVCYQYGSHYFEKLDEDECWVDISDVIASDDSMPKLGIMLLRKSIYDRRESSVQRNDAAKSLVEKFGDSNGVF